MVLHSTLHIYTCSVRQRGSLSSTLGQHTHRFHGLLFWTQGLFKGPCMVTWIDLTTRGSPGITK